MNASGPDVAPIECYTPDGCCGPSPCAIDEDQFICQIRSLLPEGDLYNNTLPPSPPETELAGIGNVAVGCAKVGSEQLVAGGCCGDDLVIQCDFIPVAPQLAVVDSFSAVAYQAVVALCKMLRELDPCTADETLHRWADRFGITHPDCDGTWSDEVLSTLVCIMLQIRLHVINWDFLTTLAARFGASFTMSYAGDFNCGPIGWWTMARDRDQCPPMVACPPPAPSVRQRGEVARLTPTCVVPPDSINVVLCPGEVVFPPNCNNPHTPDHLPHDPELYAAFKWLLPKILPDSVYWCIYECDPANCIV